MPPQTLGGTQEWRDENRPKRIPLYEKVLRQQQRQNSTPPTQAYPATLVVSNVLGLQFLTLEKKYVVGKVDPISHRGVDIFFFS